jgi:hypothetical protein
VSYVLNFIVEILLVLIYDLGSAVQTVNNFHFYVMWVAGLE